MRKFSGVMKEDQYFFDYLFRFHETELNIRPCCLQTLQIYIYIYILVVKKPLPINFGRLLNASTQF